MEYHEDGSIVLKIMDARIEDSGEYRCDAVNDNGAAWTTGPIKVATEGEFTKEGEAPDFSEPIKPVTVSFYVRKHGTVCLCLCRVYV